MDENKCIHSTVGFTGHIPGYRDEFGHSYGLTVSRMLSLPHPNDPPPPPPKRYNNCHSQRLTRRECCHPNRVEETGDNGYTMPEVSRSHCNGGRNHQYHACDPSFSKQQRDRRCFLRNLIDCCEMACADDNCCPRACPDNCDEKITLPCVTCHNQCSECKPGNDPSAQESMRRRLEEQSRLLRRSEPLWSYPYEKTPPCQEPSSIIPGYAGYVPFERGIYGIRRGAATKEGLRRFQKCVKEDCGTVDLPNGGIFDCATGIEYDNPNKPAILEGPSYNTFSESTDRSAEHSRTCCANCHPPVSNETSPCPCSYAVSSANHRKC